MKRKNPFPGVTRITDRHGKVRFRFRRRGFTCYLPGPYGSTDFRAAYDAAIEGAKSPIRSTTPRGTLAWVVEQYLGSARFKELSDTRKRSLRGQMDWLRSHAGDLPFDRFGTHHIEALMDKKPGPSAANGIKKAMSLLFTFAIKRQLGVTFNPARYADRRKENADGYHTWTEDEIERFLEHHGPGTKARLVVLLALNTGMARQDLTRVGWQNIKAGRISYRRGKTGVGADLPILAELAEELRHVPTDQLLIITHGKGRPYQPATLGNWFRDQCKAAGVPGSLHGLRKAGATRLANEGATPDEIRSYLAHATNKEGSTYTGKADRARLADSGFAKLKSPKHEQNLSNLPEKLDKEAGK